MITCLLHPGEGFDVVGIAQSGWYGERVTPWGKSSTTSYDKKFETCWHQVVEGGYLIDKRPVDPGKLYDLTVHGPMLSLTATEPEKCPEPSAMLLLGLSGAWQNLALRRAVDPEWRGLDQIPLLDYLAMWQHEGAKVGKRVGDIIEWADSTTSPVPACDCWIYTCLGCKSSRYYVDRAPSTGDYITRARVPSGPDDHCPACKEAGNVRVEFKQIVEL